MSTCLSSMLLVGSYWAFNKFPTAVLAGCVGLLQPSPREIPPSVYMVNVPQSLGGGPVKLFVRGLSKSLTSDDVLRIFQEYGGIEEVFIMKDRETHESR
ncbi:hypothetical protein FOZ63_020172, partial [Perkinsus olseni]